MAQQNDPWAEFRWTPAPQAPVAAPTLPTVRPPTAAAKREQDYRRTEQQSALDANQDARADTAVGIQLAKEERDRIEFERKQKQLGITGDVDTTESEKTAAFLATQLEDHFRNIRRITEKHPEAVQPGILETAAEALGNPTLKGFVTSKSTEGARQQLENRYGLAVDALLTLGTGAAYTEQQFKTYREAYAPRLTDTPETLEDKKNMLRSAIQAARVKSGAGAVNIDRALDELYSAPIQQQRSIDDIATPDQQQKSSTVRRTDAPPGMSEEHALWVRQNPNATPRDYVEFRKQLSAKYRDKSGNMYSTDNLSEQRQEIADYLDYYRKNPNAEIPGLMQEEPLTSAESISAKMSDFLGEGPATGLAQLGNAGSFGAVDALASRSQKRAFDKAEDRKSDWAAAGDILGSIAPSVAMEKGIGALARTALGREAPVAASLFGEGGYNAIRGAAGADEGEGLKDAAMGGMAGGVGAVGGRLIGRGAQSFQAPETSKAINELTAGGTDLTTLQRAGLGRVEELGQGLPIVRGAREKSIKSWNIANVNDALSHVGEKLPKGVKAGTEANDAMNQILNAKYSELRPKIVGNFDQQFRNSVAALAASGKGSKLKRDLFTEISDVMRPLANGYDGNTFKDADSRLRALATDWMKATAETTTSPSTYHEMGRLAEKIRKQLRFQVERNTPEVARDLKALDRAWSKSIRIEDASLRALKSEGVYAPGQMVETIKKLDTSPRKGMSSRGKAFGQKEATNAGKILGSKPVPETESWLQTGGLGYLAGQVVGLPLTASVGAAAYAPGFKRITQALLTAKRPEKLQKLTKAIPPEVISAVLARRQATED